MKKRKVMLFSLILALVLMCGVILTNSSFTNKSVYAKGMDNGHIIVVGKGEIEAAPDTVRVSFSLKCRAESLQAGQTKMRETIKNITDKIKEYNKDAEVYTNYSSSYPVFEGGLLGYEFDSCLIVKSPDVEGVNGLVDTIAEAGATSVHNVSYMLDKKDEYYILALKQAKQNAEDKANAIYSNLTLKGLKEEAVYNYCEGNQNQKIKITAKVTAFYKVNESADTQNITNKEVSSKNAFSEKTSSTTSAQTKTENIVKNDSSVTKKQNAENNVKDEELTGSQINNEEKILDETSKKSNNETTSSVETSSEVTSNKKVNNSKTNKVSSKEDVQAKKTAKTNNEPLSIIDANGNVVLEII